MYNYWYIHDLVYKLNRYNYFDAKLWALINNYAKIHKNKNIVYTEKSQVENILKIYFPNQYEKSIQSYNNHRVKDANSIYFLKLLFENYPDMKIIGFYLTYNNKKNNLIKDLNTGQNILTPDIDINSIILDLHKFSNYNYDNFLEFLIEIGFIKENNIDGLSYLKLNVNDFINRINNYFEKHLVFNEDQNEDFYELNSQYDELLFQINEFIAGPLQMYNSSINNSINIIIPIHY